MNQIHALLQFANLLEIANLSASGGNSYAQQEELIKLCREQNLPFVATMPMRHQFRCASCSVVQEESIYHFENPRVATSQDSSKIIWGPAKGVFSQLETQVLHNVLVHGQVMPVSLSEVLLSVSG